MKVLVVEDEPRLASAIARGLRGHGFDVVVARDGHTAYRLARETSLDLIVLDLMLPGLSGQEVCTRLHRDGFWTPILVLTAMDRESDETACLGLGADDYLRKPFSFPVLVARSRALGRRGPVALPLALSVGDVVLDPRDRTVRRGERPVQLTHREFTLLEYLLRHAGRVCSKDELLREVWSEAGTRDPNLVEVYVGYLRRKLDDPESGVATIRTVRGRGYVVGTPP